MKSKEQTNAQITVNYYLFFQFYPAQQIIQLTFFPAHRIEKFEEFAAGILSEFAGCDSENSPILRQKGSGKAEFYPSPQKKFLLFFQQPGLQSFESTQLTKGWLSQTLHLNKGPGKER